MRIARADSSIGIYTSGRASVLALKERHSIARRIAPGIECGFLQDLQGRHNYFALAGLGRFYGAQPGALRRAIESRHFVAENHLPELVSIPMDLSLGYSQTPLTGQKRVTHWVSL
ncbi:MAG: hypothetical protein M3R15_01165 [Acidobacteriota bacterium]|nr:hypothetical protein [Acidobacteriota bacterium]